MKVLIVDDKEENLYMLESLLAGNGYKILSASNGAEALDLLSKEKVELIIADILMPVMDGFSLCRECKTNDKYKNIPFIFYTATYTDKKDEDFALDLGADRFILKPQDPDVFIKIVKDLLTEVKQNQLNPKKAPEVSEKVLLREYNESLIRKLEDKMQQAEESERKLKHNVVELEETIGKRKKVEKELIEAKNKAELSDRLKTEFLAQMSHEIRSPLNAILNFTQVVKEVVDKEDDEILQTSFSAIDSASKRIIRTVDSILNMSELQLGTYNVNIQECDLVYTVNSLVREFKSTADNKKLNLEFNCDLEKAIISTDDYAVKQIFSNLIDNALKYTHDGGVEVKLYSGGNNNYCVEVSDTGIGIGEEFLPILFEPFRQEEQGYTRSFEGSGLGMALTNKYSKLIQADLDVKSVKYKGTTFTVRLPDLSRQ